MDAVNDRIAVLETELRALRESAWHRLSLQPGTTRTVNGVTYVLNHNHRWTRPNYPQGGGGRQAGRQSPGAGAGAVAATAAPPGGAKTRNRPYLQVNVEEDANGDGVTDAARVGVPAFAVPPPPSRIPRIPGLTGQARQAESSFARAFETSPDKICDQFIDLLSRRARPGEPLTFGTDDAKELSRYWATPKLAENPMQRAKNRATLNTALHQTANAIAKRAFVQHLDSLKPGDTIMVTVGGCGAGKGFALKNVPQALEQKQKAAVVWDSAGDQNATENPWILHEARKRRLKVTYVYVHADPHTQWAHPERGVVKRAQDPNDGRMVDAKVFADSYAIGARNHYTFAAAHSGDPDTQFLFLRNGNPPELLDRMPPEALAVNRTELEQFAVATVRGQDSIPSHVRDGALQGQNIWKD